MDGVEASFVIIQLILSPRAFTSDYWKGIFEYLARKGLISSFCIDEAHEVELRRIRRVKIS